MIVRIFTASVLAKPLNNAQIVRGVFCLYAYMATRIPFIKTYQNRGGRWQVGNAEERKCGC